MTDNHILIYRLAELMLDHEQHMLQVDLLFDDEQIGHFVKSIQIDSPYQQLQFEGVLTETIQEEKLVVYFSVEGYFHYVLGEVIYNHTEGKGPELLKQLVEANNLNGVKEGVEQCLIRDVQKDELSRLMWLIDCDEKFVNLGSYPLFIGFKSRYQTIDSRSTRIKKSKINELISLLLIDTTENDLKVIYETISLANKLNLLDLANSITVCLINSISLESESKVELIAKVLEFIQDNKLRIQTVDKLKIWLKKRKVHDMTELEVNSGIAKSYEVLHMLDETELYYKKCLKYERKHFGENHKFTSISYNQLGLLKLQRQQNKAALYYFKKSLKIHTLLELRFEITTVMHNIALAYQHLSNFKKCISQYELVLTRRLKDVGKTTLDSALTISNLGFAYIQSTIDQQKGEKLLLEALKINDTILGNPNLRNTGIYRFLAFSDWQKEKPDFEKIEDLLNKALKINLLLAGEANLNTAYCFDDLFRFYQLIDKTSKAIKNGEKAFEIYNNILGLRHPLTKEVFNKLEELKSK